MAAERIEIHTLLREKKVRERFSVEIPLESDCIHYSYDDFRGVIQAAKKNRDLSIIVYQLPEDIEIPDPLLQRYSEQLPDVPIICLGPNEPKFDLLSLDSLIEFLPIKGISTLSLSTTLRSLLARRNAATAIKQSSDDMRSMMRELSMTELGAGLAHDSKNILSATVGHLELLEKQIQEGASPEVRRHLNISLAGCKHVASLLQEWLQITKSQETESKASIPIKDLMKGVVEIVSSLTPINVELKFQISTNAHTHAVQHQLEQALVNLIINAFQAIPDHGEVKISVYQEEENNKVSPIVIQIVDTGKGIPEEKLKDIFNPFFSTKEKEGGSGLGLAMVNRIVEQHNGTLYLHSTEKIGTCFQITLPAVIKELETLKDCDEILEDKETNIYENIGTIVVIDDTPPLLSVMEEFLTEAGMIVHPFENPTEAVRWFAKHSKEVDMVLLDLHMPNMNGDECFTALKEISPHIDVVIYSGEDSDEVDSLLKKGALKFFQKPLDFKKTVDWIQKAVSEQR